MKAAVLTGFSRITCLDIHYLFILQDSLSFLNGSVGGTTNNITEKLNNVETARLLQQRRSQGEPPPRPGEGGGRLEGAQWLWGEGGRVWVW
jgi:hypothetical protein